MKPFVALALALSAAVLAPNAAAAHQPGYAHHDRGPVIVDRHHHGERDVYVFRRGAFLQDYRRAPVILVRDWRAFGVYAPRPGLDWVRVRGDLLLVHARSGRILDVVPLRGWRYS